MHTPNTISDSDRPARVVCAADGLPWPCPDADSGPAQDAPQPSDPAEPPTDTADPAAPGDESDGQAKP